MTELDLIGTCQREVKLIARNVNRAALSSTRHGDYSVAHGAATRLCTALKELLRLEETQTPAEEFREVNFTELRRRAAAAHVNVADLVSESTIDVERVQARDDPPDPPEPARPGKKQRRAGRPAKVPKTPKLSQSGQRKAYARQDGRPSWFDRISGILQTHPAGLTSADIHKQIEKKLGPTPIAHVYSALSIARKESRIGSAENPDGPFPLNVLIK